MKREILKSKQVRQKLLDGVLQLSEVVGSTMGPKGRNILIERKFGYPTVTNDGVTIAREIELEDPYENMGAQIIMEAASRTNDSAGDGTTTATVLASEMIEAGVELLDSRRSESRSINPVMLKSGMHLAVKQASEALEKMSRKVKTKEDMKHVATISCQSEEAGAVIAEAFDKVGQDGAVQVEDGHKLGYELEIVEGMRIPGSLYTPYLRTDEKGRAVLEDCPVLVTTARITNFDDLFPVLEGLVAKGKRNLLLFCDSVMGNTLSNLVVNKNEGKFTCIPVKIEATGDRKMDLLHDIAIATGATIVGPDSGVTLRTVDEIHLGFAKKAVVGKDTIIMGGKADKVQIDQRIKELRAQVKEEVLEFDRQLLAERAARLAGGVAIVKVGASGEIELKELKYRLEDALNATRAAIEEGVVPGGGMALLNASKAIDLDSFTDPDQKEGARLVQLALRRPFDQIVRNAGGDPRALEERIRTKEEVAEWEGYNAATGAIEDLNKAGVIDPKKVARLALENAASVAGIFLTTEAAISLKPTNAPTN